MTQPVQRQRKSPHRDLDWAALLTAAWREDVGAAVVARRLGVSQCTVRHYAALHQLDLRIRHRRSSKGIDWISELQAAQREGVCAKGLARRLDVHRATVERQAKRLGFGLGVRRDWRAEFARARKQGESQSAMARRLGVSRQAVSLAARKLGELR